MNLFVRRKGKRKIPAVGFIFCEASPSRRSLFFEIFSHARVYARGDDEKKKIYFLYIFLFFYFTLFYLLVLKQPLLSSLCNKLGWSRKKGVTILTIVACIGTVIFSTGCSSYLVGVVDGFVNNFGILILIGVQAIIFGWLYGVEKVIPVLNEFSTFKVGKTWVFTLKYLLPILLIIVWIFGVVDLFHNESAFEIIIYAIITIIVVGLSAAFTKLSPKKS